MREIAGTTALVTGANGSLGAATTRLLADHGVRLLLSGRDAGRLTERAAQVAPSVVGTVCADLMNPADVADLAGHADGVDLVVHLAGVERAAPFTALTEQDLAEHLQVNLHAPLALALRLVPGMLQRGRGHLVFVGSLSALVGGAYQIPYAATKAGLDTAVRALRAEYAGTHVGFSAVHPAPIRGAGSYRRRAAQVGAAPRLVGETSPAQVAAAIVMAIRRNREQVIVAHAGVRPLLALRAVAPAAAARVVELTGATRYFARVARTET
jgi:short-subunit dehydrogenase